MGVKTPAGVDVDTLWATVCAGQRRREAHRALRPVRAARCSSRARSSTTTPRRTSGPKEVRRVDRFTQLGFGAAADAHRATPASSGPTPAACAVIAATGVGGLETMEENEATFLERGASRVSPFFVPMMMPNAAAGHDLDPLRLHRPGAVHLHRVRGRRQRHRRGRAHGPRRQRRRRGRRRHRGAGHPAHRLRVRPHGRDEHPQRRPRSARRVRSTPPATASSSPRARRSACSRPLEHALGRGATHPRRGARLRPQRRRAPHHRAGARRRGCGRVHAARARRRRPRRRRHRPRERARHVDAAQRRRRGRGDPQGVRRRSAARHVHQGRHRAHDRAAPARRRP